MLLSSLVAYLYLRHYDLCEVELLGGTCPAGQVWVCSGESGVPPHGDALGWLLSWGLLPWAHSGKPTLLC